LQRETGRSRWIRKVGERLQGEETGTISLFSRREMGKNATRKKVPWKKRELKDSGGEEIKKENRGDGDPREPRGVFN